MLSSVARLDLVLVFVHSEAIVPSHISKCSFQYGFNVLLMTEVVFVCSPLSVATAKGSGNPIYHQLGVLSTLKQVAYGRHRACITHQQQLLHQVSGRKTLEAKGSAD